MLITKKINNNVAMAEDAEGNELVVFGRGVGFPPTPYELSDTGTLQRVFRHVDSTVLQALRDISADIIDISIEILEYAGKQLNCNLSPNAFLSLGDHLQFTIERLAEGITIHNPLVQEVTYIYAREYEIGQWALRLIHERLGVELPENEACSIALHLVNAEADGGVFTDNIADVMKTTEAIDGVISIVEKHLGGGTLDRTSYGFARFVMHVRYLIRRLMQGTPVESQNVQMFKQLIADFPEAHSCAEAIRRYLKHHYGWTCSDEEVLYLMMYINRLLSGF